MKALALKINNLIQPLRTLSDSVASPFFDLGVRFYMAHIFFSSGMLKFENFLNDDWESTTFLFEEIHPIPGVNSDLSAVAGTAGELILPILLALGLFGRLGAAGLLIMTATIQFAIPAEYGMQNPDHYFWMFLLGMILLKGSGNISVDHVIQKWLNK
ncbi:MAG: DoxX family protein [Alphaproteobacteria bacterium]|nr:DoxX family protein [Alphaproteobacteria bacterium]